MAKPMRIRLYVELADAAAADTAMLTAIGDVNPFRLTRATNFKYCSLGVTLDEKDAILAAFNPIPTLRYFIVTNSANNADARIGAQYLRETNVADAEASIGALYSIAQSDTAAAIPIVITSQADVYAASWGTTTGTGTAGNPVLPRNALIGIPRRATANVYFLPGDNEIVSATTTNVAANVTVRPAPGVDWTDVRLVLKGIVTVATAGLTIRDLHVRGNPADRYAPGTTLDGFDTPADMGGFVTAAADVKYKNLHMNDLLQISAQSNCPRTVYEENISYNFGVVADDRWHNHQLYAQNQPYTAGQRKNVNRNVFGQTGGAAVGTADAGGNFGLHIYGKADSVLAGFNINGNFYAFSQSLIGGKSPVHTLTFEDNVSYRGKVDFGYETSVILGNGGAVAILDSYFWLQERRPLLIVRPNANLTLQGNVFSGDDYIAQIDPVEATPVIELNNWYTNNGATQFVSYNGSGRTFSAWQGLGFDDVGSQQSGYPPDVVIIQPLQEPNNLCNVAIFNRNAQANNVTVNIAGLGATTGDTIRYVNVFNFAQYTEVAYPSGGNLSLPMTGWTIPSLIGTVNGSPPPAPPWSLNKDCMMFRIEKVV